MVYLLSKYLPVWWFLAYYCCAATLSLKEEIEGLQELDKSVEILVRLLCAVPGWNEKNVQVCFIFHLKSFYLYFRISPENNQRSTHEHITWKRRFSNRSLKSSLTYLRLRLSFLRNVSYYALRVSILWRNNYFHLMVLVLSSFLPEFFF